jgi:anti-sigma B factor antagonist
VADISVSGHRDGSILTVVVAGEVDLATSPTVDRAIADAIATDGVTVVRVDLSGVEFLDSSGIALLLKGRRGADERGIGFQVTGAHGIVQQVLEMTGVWAHLSGDPSQPTTP